MRLIDAEYLLDLIKDIDGERFGYVDAEDINNAPTVDAVPVSTLEQIKWERDSFVEQIREIGGEPFAKWDAMDVVKVVRCKDCKHYELDSWAKVNGIPLIVAHNICKRWGEGCKTDENGFCFMGEKVTE